MYIDPGAAAVGSAAGDAGADRGRWMMTNPFQYGAVVAGDAFCNRRSEQRDLLRAVENGEKLFVYAERRLGKTSLVRTVLDSLSQKRFIGVYVDLWPTDSEASFAVLGQP
jgi:hypothetical protein